MTPDRDDCSPDSPKFTTVGQVGNLVVFKEAGREASYSVYEVTQEEDDPSTGSILHIECHKTNPARGTKNNFLAVNFLKSRLNPQTFLSHACQMIGKFNNVLEQADPESLNILVGSMPGSKNPTPYVCQFTLPLLPEDFQGIEKLDERYLRINSPVVNLVNSRRLGTGFIFGLDGSTGRLLEAIGDFAQEAEGVNSGSFQEIMNLVLEKEYPKAA